MVLSFWFKKIMIISVKFSSKLDSTSFLKIQSKIPIEKIHHQKLEKNLKFMKNEIFTLLERPLVYLHFDIIFMLLSFSV
jgi:hypothetical protein